MVDKTSANNGIKVLTKEDFKKAGINKDLFSQILKKPVKDFDVNEEIRGPRFRSAQYSIDVEFRDGEKLSIWGKDYFRNLHLSQEYKSDAEFDGNEMLISRLLMSQKGFVPTFYEEREFKVGNNVHKIIFMEKFQSDLGDILASSIDRKLKLGDVLKTIDIYLVNNLLITNYFKPPTVKGREKIYKYDYGLLSSNLKLFMESLLKYVFHNDGGLILDWSGENNWPIIESALYGPEYDDNIAKILSNNPDNDTIISMNFFPAHVLINPASYLQNEYKESDFLKIKKGRPEERTQYEGMVITDLDKVGYAPLALGIATFINHPSFRKSELNSKDLIEICTDHTVQQYLKLKHDRDTILPHDEIMTDYKPKFKDLLNAASIYAILRNMFFIAELSQEFPKEMEEFERRSPSNNRTDFLIANIDNLSNIEEKTNYYIKDLKKGMENIKKYLATSEAMQQEKVA